MAESEYRLSPSLESPFQSGDGLPVPQMIRFCSESYEPVTQVGPPPVFHDSPDHESCPFSPGPGIVQKRHRRLPVRASYASRNPRIPYSPPEMPVTTISFTIS